MRLTRFLGVSKTYSLLLLLWAALPVWAGSGLQVAPTVLTVSSVPAGLDWERPLKITNVKSEALYLRLSLSKPSALFSIDASDCDDALAPMDSCLIWVRFSSSGAPAEHINKLFIGYRSTRSAPKDQANERKTEPGEEVPLKASVTEPGEGWFELGESEYQAVLDAEEARGAVLLGLSKGSDSEEGRVQLIGPMAPFKVPLASASPTYAEASVALKPMKPWLSTQTLSELDTRVQVVVQSIRFWSDMVELNTVPLEQCRGKEPISATIDLERSHDLEQSQALAWSRGRDLEVAIRWPEFENCSFYTEMLNTQLSGKVAWQPWILRPFLRLVDGI